MSFIKIVSAAIVLSLASVSAQAQVGRRLQEAATGAAERAATRQTEQRTEDAVNRAIDNALDGNRETQQQQNEQQQQNQQNQQQPQEQSSNSSATASRALEMAYAQNDFVPGDEVMFDDQLAGERMGEFPSQWDLLDGNAEISRIAGENVIFMREFTAIAPLMKNPRNYLPDAYTIEFDFYIEADHPGWWQLQLIAPNAADIGDDTETSRIAISSAPHANRDIEGRWKTASGDRRSSSSVANLSAAGWHRVSVSFNQRALKIYIDGVRIMNVPNVAQAGWFRIHCTDKHYIRDIRIARGAVPLYDRMMSDGKFITYGITFDVGKSTIKPESMGEINRIAALMRENPDLRFSVEGHTDATGSAASNQTLSEARSQSVVDKLAENGIARDRLRAAGKGQSSPIADNATDEGRAKNRRVEFVKI